MIAFFYYLSDDLTVSFKNCNDLKVIIGVCVEHVCEIYSFLKLIHDSNHCTLKNCKIGLFVC